MYWFLYDLKSRNCLTCRSPENVILITKVDESSIHNFPNNPSMVRLLYCLFSLWVFLFILFLLQNAEKKSVYFQLVEFLPFICAGFIHNCFYKTNYKKSLKTRYCFKKSYQKNKQVGDWLFESRWFYGFFKNTFFILKINWFTQHFSEK